MAKKTFPALADAIAEYPGYVPFDDTQPNQYYKPFKGSEPWNCACVAIWELADGQGCTEEY